MNAVEVLLLLFTVLLLCGVPLLMRGGDAKRPRW